MRAGVQLGASLLSSLYLFILKLTVQLGSELNVSTL